MTIKLIGFFTDNKSGKPESAQEVFVALDTNEKRLTIYSPTEQHSEGDRAYVDECTRISKEDYMNISKSFYTPQEYLDLKINLDKKPRTKKPKTLQLFTNRDGLICMANHEPFWAWESYHEGEVKIEVPAVNAYDEEGDSFHVTSFSGIKINGHEVPVN